MEGAECRWQSLQTAMQFYGHWSLIASGLTSS
jgi:hypothetical protein